MSLSFHRYWAARRPLVVLGLLTVAGCSSLGDLGRLDQPVVADNIHAWVGQEAASRAGAPVSLNNLTDDERTLRDLAFPLIEPAYDRIRWDAVLYEYGQKREFQRKLWTPDPTAYYRKMLAGYFRSTAGRYNRLTDDIRNDVVRIGPFFDLARRIVEIDRKRQAALDSLPDISPGERVNAVARIGENTLTVAWVQNSLAQRCASYRYALNRLTVSEPDNAAAQVDIALAHMQQQMAANQLVVSAPNFAAEPREVAEAPPSFLSLFDK